MCIYLILTNWNQKNAWLRHLICPIRAARDEGSFPREFRQTHSCISRYGCIILKHREMLVTRLNHHFCRLNHHFEFLVQPLFLQYLFVIVKLIHLQQIHIVSCEINVNSTFSCINSLLVLSREWMGMGEWDDYY